MRRGRLADWQGADTRIDVVLHCPPDMGEVVGQPTGLPLLNPLFGDALESVCALACSSLACCKEIAGYAPMA